MDPFRIAHWSAFCFKGSENRQQTYASGNQTWQLETPELAMELCSLENHPTKWGDLPALAARFDDTRDDSTLCNPQQGFINMPLKSPVPSSKSIFDGQWLDSLPNLGQPTEVHKFPTINYNSFTGQMILIH